MPVLPRTDYAQYKQDTAQLATWIAKSAVSLGFPITAFIRSSIDDCDNQPRTSSQLKTAKRKKARAQAKARMKAAETVEEPEEVDEVEDEPIQEVRASVDPAADHIAAPTPGNYLLRIPQFVELASFLVTRNYRIPVEVVRILRRCIKLRKRSSKSFQTTDDPAHGSHLHFVEALETVLSKFAPRISGSYDKRHADGGRAAPDKSGTQDHQPASLANRFATLSVETDDDEETDDHADIQIPGMSGHEPLRFEPEMSITEALNAVIMFFKDVQSIRYFNQDLWWEYRLGQIDLTTAALILIAVFMGLWRTNSPGKTFGEVPHWDEVRSDDRVTQELFEFLLFPIADMLQNLRLRRDPSGLWAHPVPGYYKNYDPADTSPLYTYHKRWERAMPLLAGILFDFYAISQNTKVDVLRRLGTKVSHVIKDRTVPTPYDVDDLFHHVRDFYSTGQWTIMLVVRLQFLVDINMHLNDGQAEAAYCHMRNQASQIVDLIGQHRALCRLYPNCGWRPGNDRLVAQLEERAKFRKERDLEIMQRLFPQMGNTCGQMLKRNPTLCGMALSELRVMYRQVGFAMAQNWDSIVGAAHLYRMCQFTSSAEGKDFPRWVDMENILDSHGREYLLASKDMPESFGEAYGRWLKVHGYTDRAIRTIKDDVDGRPRNRKGLGRDFDRGKTYGNVLHDNSQVTSIYTTKFTNNEMTGKHFSLDTVQKAIIDYRRAHPTQDLDLKLVQNPRSGRNRTRRYRLTTIQILGSIRDVLQSESAALRFDYVSMHLRCVRFLHTLHDRALPLWELELGPGGGLDKANPRHIIYDLFHLGLEQEKRQRHRKEPDTTSDQTFRKMVEVLQDTLASLLRTEGESDAESRRYALNLVRAASE